MAKVAEPEEIAARRNLLGALMQGVRVKMGKSKQDCAQVIFLQRQPLSPADVPERHGGNQDQFEGAFTPLGGQRARGCSRHEILGSEIPAKETEAGCQADRLTPRQLNRHPG